MFKKYKSLKEFVSYFWKYKKLFPVLAFAMLSASSLGMLCPYLVSKRILLITDIDTTFDIIIKYSIIIMTVIFFHHIFWYLWEKLASVLTNKIAADIRKDIMSKFIDTKYSEIKNKTSGYYLERINDDVLEVSSFFSNIMGICADCLTNFSFVVIIYFLNYRCGLIFTAGIFILYLFEFAKIKVNIKYIEILKELNEKFNSKVNENYRGIKDIKGLGIKNQMLFDFDNISKKIADTQIKKDRIFALLSRCKTYAQYSVEAVMIIYAAGVLIPNHEISVIILLTIVNYSYFMYDLVGYIAKIKDYFVRGDFKAKRILQVLDNQNDNIEKFGDCGKDQLDSFGIEIRDLSFSYDNGVSEAAGASPRPTVDNNDFVLKNINLKIPEKSVTVFVGNSGSGKTTLFGLLSRILHCENNIIFIGGVDINDLSEDCLRDHMCIVNQEPFLMNDTVLNNIKIVKPSAELHEVYEACRKAHIFDEINDFENGFDTVVSENGSNLSGGQKQRISIARAVLKDSDILLFDEPTSSLDKRNQELFFETVRELKNGHGKTVLLIAHRLASYDGFDFAYELREDGSMIGVNV